MTRPCSLRQYWCRSVTMAENMETMVTTVTAVTSLVYCLIFMTRDTQTLSAERKLRDW